jgi:glutaredoxin
VGRFGHWFHRNRFGGLVEVVFYTRAGCHLCDDAKTILSQQQEDYGFALTVVDIDTDPALAERYGECVPVVVVNGRERFRGHVNPLLFARLLKSLGCV